MFWPAASQLALRSVTGGAPVALKSRTLAPLP